MKTDEASQAQVPILGIWLFLISEMTFFGGLFVAYIVYRQLYFEDFVQASLKLNTGLGTVNTALLLTSSFFVALAKNANEKNLKGRCLQFLCSAQVLGGAFLVVKAFEYREDFHRHLVPAFHFIGSSKLEMFFIFYFLLTLMHAVHMVVGICLLFWASLRVFQSPKKESVRAQVEVTGLYWHFVDIVWLFLFPMLYLIRGMG